MRHYEVIIMIHPDRSDEVNKIIKQYTDKISLLKGKIHRIEDWGRKQLAYSINKLHKAHYILMNFEISYKFIEEIKNDFRYNKYIIRNMIIRVNKAITELSPMMKIKDEKNDKKNNSLQDIKTKISIS